MASADLIINTLQDVANNKSKEFEAYNEELCNNIKQRIDTKLREQNLSISDRALFVNIISYYHFKKLSDSIGYSTYIFCVLIYFND